MGVSIDSLEYSIWSRERFEEWRRGGLDAVHVTCAIWEDQREAVREVTRMRRHIRDNSDILALATSGAEIRAAKSAGKTAVIIGFQNASPLEDDLDLVDAFHALGVRIIQLTYNIQNLVGGSCYEEKDGGVSSRFGRNVIREMNRVGVLVDLSHCGEQTCLDAIEISERPVAITHGNPAEFVGDTIELRQRNRSNRVIQALTERGGMIGLSMYPRIAPDGPNVTLKRFCEMVAWTAERFGAEKIGIGSDLYLEQPADRILWWRAGRWAREPLVPIRSGLPEFPEWFRTPADFQNVAAGLKVHGFKPHEVEGVMGENWLRFFDKAWKPA